MSIRHRMHFALGGLFACFVVSAPASAQYGCTRYYDGVRGTYNRFACEQVTSADPYGAHAEYFRRRQLDVERTYRDLLRQQTR